MSNSFTLPDGHWSLIIDPTEAPAESRESIEPPPSVVVTVTKGNSTRRDAGQSSFYERTFHFEGKVPVTLQRRRRQATGAEVLQIVKAFLTNMDVTVVTDYQRGTYPEEAQLRINFDPPKDPEDLTMQRIVEALLKGTAGSEAADAVFPMPASLVKDAVGASIVYPLSARHDGSYGVPLGTRGPRAFSVTRKGDNCCVSEKSSASGAPSDTDTQPVIATYPFRGQLTITGLRVIPTDYTEIPSFYLMLKGGRVEKEVNTVVSGKPVGPSAQTFVKRHEGGYFEKSRTFDGTQLSDQQVALKRVWRDGRQDIIPVTLQSIDVSVDTLNAGAGKFGDGTLTVGPCTTFKDKQSAQQGKLACAMADAMNNESTERIGLEQILDQVEGWVEIPLVTVADGYAAYSPSLNGRHRMLNEESGKVVPRTPDGTTSGFTKAWISVLNPKLSDTTCSRGLHGC